MRYRHHPSKLVGDVNISMNIQYAAIISETPDVPHIGPPFRPGGKSSSPQKIADHVALCPRSQWDQTRTWAKLRETSYFGNRRTPIRRVGAPFRNNRAIPKPTFRLTKHTPVGEVGTNCRRETEERDVYFANVSVYSKSCFNLVLSWIDRTSDRFRLHENTNVFFKGSQIEVRKTVLSIIFPKELSAIYFMRLFFG